MADGGSSQNLVLVTTKIDSTTYTALMSKELAELYRSPQCDPMTRKALAEGLRILGMNHHVPALKCHVPVMKLRLKMNHLAALQGQVSPPHQNSTSASSSTSEQEFHNLLVEKLDKLHLD
uniref:Sox C-terminal domain-containing protein n=1 Tax=Magallana gigas TaxID=29159 RepID=A0A8W8JEY5_MAGGI